MNDIKNYVYNLTIASNEKPDENTLFNLLDIIQNELNIDIKTLGLDYLGERKYDND